MEKENVENSDNIIQKINNLQNERIKCTKKGGTSTFYREGFNNQIDKLLISLEDLQMGTHKKEIINLNNQIDKIERKIKKANYITKMFYKRKIKRYKKKILSIQESDLKQVDEQKKQGVFFNEVYEKDKKMRINEIESRLKEIRGILTNVGIKMDTGTYHNLPQHVTSIYDEKSFLEKELADLESINKYKYNKK